MKPCETDTTSEAHFTCSICAQPGEILILSARSLPEESDTCRACNKDADAVNNLSISPANTKLTSSTANTLASSLIHTNKVSSEDIPKCFDEFLQSFQDENGLLK